MLKAIAAVLSQEGVRAVPLLIVNGPHVDAELLRQLARRKDLRCVRIARTVSIMDFAPTFAARLGVALPDVDGTAIPELLT